MLAEDLLSGIDPDEEDYRTLSDLAPHDVFACLPGADMIRDYYFGREIQLCTIANGKSGRCTEDCSFCSQSAFSKTDAPIYPLMAKEALQETGRNAYETPIARYSIVTSGKRLPREEVIAAYEILKSLNLRQHGPILVSCPTCGRAEVDIIKLAEQVEEQLLKVDKPIKVAVMGCVVNGPGEAKDADIGIACGKAKAVLFKKGKKIGVIEEKDFLTTLMAEVERF